MKKLSVKNQMKFNPWTVALAAIGVVSLASAARADEQPMQMNAVQTALSSTTISGYVDTAAVWRPGTDKGTGLIANPGTPPPAFVPQTYANIPAGTAPNDGFYLNSVDIAIDHPEDASPWAAGYHVEFMVGPDAVGAPIAGSATLRQAYLTLRTPIGNGIDWKVGVWDTIIGYESSSDPLNPNYSRSYGWWNEPTTHTGILATYKINDMFTIQGGIADDSNISGTIGVNANHFESQKAYMGSIAFTAPESAGFMQGATLYLAAVDAAGTSASPGSTSFYTGVTLPTPVKALTLGAAFDYLDIHNGPVNGTTTTPTANPSNDSVWVLGLYSTYQATDKLSLNLRGEYMGDNGAGPYGSAAEELTATVQYNLWANVISRLEFRWDHAEHGNPFGYSATDVSPTNLNGSFRSNDFMLALNLIYQF